MTHSSTDEPSETPGGSTISDPDVFNDPEDTGETGGTQDEELDAPDPA